MEKQIKNKQRLVIAITGASGAQLGINLLKKMRNYMNWETHLIISNAARETIKQETNFSANEVKSLADKTYPLDNMGASIASGSFQTAGMVIAPCSMKTLAGIRIGFSSNLILRTADVTIKEKRPLVLLTRETPLNPIHLENMLYLSKINVTILPPVLTYYNNPSSVKEQTEHIVNKVLDVFGLAPSDYKRWEGNN